jgi:dienelactone hydrolase
MKSSLAAFCLLLGCTGNKPSQERAPDRASRGEEPAAVTNDARAREFVDLLVKNRFSEAEARFNDRMKAALPAEKLQQTWQSLVGQVGSLEAVAGTRAEHKDAHETIFVTCQFEKVALDAKVVFDRDHLITGLFFVPTQEASSDWTPPTYAAKDRFDEKEIAVGTGEWQLPGTLALPIGQGPFPALILVHGSGPQDRDETLGPNKPFRDLAWGLASKGIAVIRYDKRTKVHAAKLAAVRDLTVQHEVIDDAVAAAAAARATDKIDPRRVFILGHSLGGYLVPRILAGDHRITGAILMAGSARPMQQLILEQIDYIAHSDGTVSKEEAAKIDEIKADLARLEAPSFSAASPPVFGVPASYWIDLRTYQPVTAAKAIDRPMLILQGGRDYQVTRTDFSLWENGLKTRKNVRLRLFPDLNHLFIAGTGKSTPEEYGVEGKHVAPEVVDEIAGWIAALPSR